MIQFIYSWIKNIVIYLVLVTIIMNLLGKNSYKKYIQIFTGMLLIVLVITPILKLCKSDKAFSYFFDSYNFVVEAEDISNKISDIEEGRNQKIINVYKEKLKEQIKQMVEAQKMNFVDAKIELDEDNKSDNFGFIKKVQVIVNYYKENDTNSEEQDLIDKITIDKIQIDNDSEETKKDNVNHDMKDKEEEIVTSLPIIELKNNIADFYNIPADNINITIQEQ